MARSHPPTLITIAERALKNEIAIRRGDHVLAAVSGGSDSMALVSVLARLSRKLGFALSAHGVDHGLRPAAADELRIAEDLCAELGVAFTRSMLSVERGGNLQARARTARYDALERALVQCGATHIATAHHADDRAETILLRLLRGTSVAGLAVLPPASGNRVRPLIRARKSDVVRHVTRHRIPFSEDPSNRDPRFGRTKVREQVLPLLESLSPRIVDHLNALADELSRPSVALPLDGEQPLPLLGMAQRAELAKMIERRSSSARVRLRGGKELRLGVEGRLVLANIADGEPGRD